MEIKKPETKIDVSQDKKLAENFGSFVKLIDELRSKDVPLDLVNSFNLDIDEVNSFSGSAKDLLKQLKKTQSKILKTLEKELKLVSKNHYRNLWMALGMSVFGLPIGIALGLGLGNIGLLGVGLPIGMGIGIAVGTAMDKKAVEAGNQLDFEIKY